MANLLIVEDDSLLREALAEQLAQGGHTVTTAEGGIAAQQILERQRFDAMVLDLGLPMVDGITVLKWARQRFGAMPIMILTARDGIDDRVQGLNAGADDYLTKPFDMKELLARITALLRRARLPAFGGTLQIAAGHGKVLRLDPQLPLAWVGEDMLEVTQREWSLLSLLVARAGQVVSRARWNRAMMPYTPTRLAMKAGVSWHTTVTLPSTRWPYASRKLSTAGSVSGPGISSSSGR